MSITVEATPNPTDEKSTANVIVNTTPSGVVASERTPSNAPQTQSTADPTFIVGCPRSGTTLLLDLLGDFTPLAACRDDGMALRFYDLLPTYGDLSQSENAHRLVSDMMESYEYQRHFRGPHLPVECILSLRKGADFGSLVDALFRAKAFQVGKDRWIDKTTFYAYRLGDLMKVFPRAKIIHMVRDGRDVALSLSRCPFGPKNAYFAARYWKNYLEQISQSSKHVPASRMLTVDYESLLSKPDDTFAQMAQFLDLSSEETKAWRHRHPERIKSTNSAKWRRELAPRDQEIFEREAGKWLAELGYDTLHDEQHGKSASLVRREYYRANNLYNRLHSGESFRKGVQKRLQSLAIRLRRKN